MKTQLNETGLPISSFIMGITMQKCIFSLPRHSGFFSISSVILASFSGFTSLFSIKKRKNIHSFDKSGNIPVIKSLSIPKDRDRKELRGLTLL